MIKVAVTGAAGRMGSGIIRKISEQDDMEVVAAIEMPNTPLAGVDAGIKAGIGEIGVEITGSEDLEETLKSSGADVLVDFTIAHAAVDTIKVATSCGVNVVVGTTGFSDEQMAENIKTNIKTPATSKYSALICPLLSVMLSLFCPHPFWKSCKFCRCRDYILNQYSTTETMFLPFCHHILSLISFYLPLFHNNLN